MISRNAYVNLDGFRLLTAREAQLVVLSSEGLTDKEIARELRISPGTVITIWSRMRAKLGITSRISAISVMVAAVTRLTTIFDAEYDLDEPSKKLNAVRIVVSSNRVVLHSTPEATKVLGVQAGDSLVRQNGQPVALLDPNGDPFDAASLPWDRQDQSTMTDRVQLKTADGTHEYDLAVRVQDDGVLGRVAFLDFFRLGRLGHREFAEFVS